MRKAVYALVIFLFLCGTSAANDLFYLGIGVDYNATGKRDDPYAADIIKVDTVLSNSYSSFFNNYHSNLILGPAANPKSVLAGFRWLEQAQPNDLVIVHIDCHGSDSKKGYVFYPNGDVYGTEMKAALAKVNAKIFIILDTCHSGALIRDWGKCGPNILIITACDINEQSFATYFLDSIIDGLAAADYDSDGIITIKELATYAAWRIKAYTSRQSVIISKSTLDYNLKLVA